MYRLSRFILASLLVPLCLFLIFARDAQAQKQLQSLSLATNGQTKYVIALAHDAIPAEKTAAQQLQQYLHQITGATFAVKKADQVSADAPQILIGPGARVKALLPNQNWKKLGHDGIIIKTIGNKLILAGGRPRGTIYAAFEFLKSLGCRWWTPTASTIPHQSTLEISPQAVVYVPPFELREHHATATFDPKFATILHENGYYLKQSKAWGGHLKQLRCSFANLLPPEKYFKEHPEWYTDPLNGDRPSTSATKMPTSRKNWELDTTNPQATEAYTKQAIQYIHNHPEGDALAIWFQDNPHYCKSPRAMKLIQEQGSPSAVMLQFVNKVAAKIHTVYPDYPVQMQAYWWTVKPPRTMKPGPGVVIDLAPIGANFGYPFNSPYNAESRDQLLAWAKMTQRLHLWYYCTDFRWRVFPFPNWDAIGKDLRFFADHHVIGMYDQGNASHNGAGDFIQLRTWLIGQLLWNPYQSQAKLTREFLKGYYGAAGPYLGKYLAMVQKAFTAHGHLLGPYNTDFTFFTLDVANRGIHLFNEAQAAVKNNPILLKRVQRSRLSLDAVVLAKLQYFQHEAKTQGKVFSGPENLGQALAAFEKAAKRFGITKFSEGTTMLLGRLKQRAGKPTGTLPPFAQGYAREDVVDFPANDLHMAGVGVITKLVHDPAAYDDLATSAIGSTNSQSIQVRIGPSLPGRQWHVYVSARLDAAPNATLTGVGFTGGVKDLNLRKMTYTYTFPMAKTAGKQYHWFDLGIHELDGGKEIRFTPPGRQDVKRIYIDRVIFVRAGAKK